MHALAPTSPALADLLDVLQEEQARFETFLALLERERRSLTKLTAADLDAVTAAKLGLLNEIQLLEHKRVRLVGALAAEWRVPAESLTLRAIADRIGGPAGDDCRRRHERLHTTLQAIREASTVNGSVISRSLAFLDRAIGMVRPQPVTAPTYTPSAGLASTAADGALIARTG